MIPPAISKIRPSTHKPSKILMMVQSMYISPSSFVFILNIPIMAAEQTEERKCVSTSHIIAVGMLFILLNEGKR